VLFLKVSFGVLITYKVKLIPGSGIYFFTSPDFSVSRISDLPWLSI